MRKSLFIVGAFFAATNLFGQSCPNPFDYSITPVCCPNTWEVVLQVNNVIGGTRSIKVECENGCFEECKSISSNGTLTFGPFYCPSPPHIKVYSYTSAHCTGTPCLTTSLSVKFQTFTVKREGASVSIKWVTASETNNKKFVVERSKPTGGWETIATIPTLAPGGNSVSSLSYSYIDNGNTRSNISYYRVKQEDIDGKFTYSEIRSLAGEKQEGVIVAPNPTTGPLYITFPDARTYDISLCDLAGSVLMKKSSVIGSVTLSTDGLSTGMYVLKITDQNGKESTKKVIIQ